ncbi:MAG: hypothetical protein ACRDRJ_34880 [Streptosporangiaceae bacterium]
MSMFRGYEVDSLGVAVAASATPILYFATTSTNDMHIYRWRAVIEGVSSSSAPPTNASVVFTINLVTGTVGGGGSVTARQRSGFNTSGALAANTTFTSAESAAITGLTQSTQLAFAEIPYATGSWELDAWENTGNEVDIPQSGKYCVYMIASQAGTACNARTVLNFAE